MEDNILRVRLEIIFSDPISNIAAILDNITAALRQHVTNSHIAPQDEDAFTEYIIIQLLTKTPDIHPNRIINLSTNQLTN